MLEPRPISPEINHEELFIQRYQWLMNWALCMTGQDKAQAQDLVHDTFVQFVISRPPLEAIQQNIEGYLYTMLRNMHVSQARRAARIREATFSLSRILSLSETSSVQSELTKVETRDSGPGAGRVVPHLSVRDSAQGLVEGWQRGSASFLPRLLPDGDSPGVADFALGRGQALAPRA